VDSLNVLDECKPDRSARRYFEPRRCQGQGRVVAVLPILGVFFLVSFEPFTYSQDALLDVARLVLPRPESAKRSRLPRGGFVPAWRDGCHERTVSCARHRSGLKLAQPTRSLERAGPRASRGMPVNCVRGALVHLRHSACSMRLQRATPHHVHSTPTSTTGHSSRQRATARSGPQTLQRLDRRRRYSGAAVAWRARGARERTCTRLGAATPPSRRDVQARTFCG
jgi:hypothetical protein